MNCAVVRARLAALLYGDLTADEAAEVREHLRGCASCQGKQAALAQVRRLLDAVPAPPVTVDLPRLYREAAEQQSLRLRRWRRVACAALAVAAAVVAVVCLSRLEVSLDANQLVLRWGTVPEPPEVPAPAPAPHPEPPMLPPTAAMAPGEVEQQLRLLSDLMRALSDDAEVRDGRRQQEINQLRAQVRGLQQQMAELRLATEKDVSALYAAQFPDREKGTQR
jgi:hypothetical protein